MKRDIVIRNKYSVPLPTRRKNGGRRGSRGGTPGEYVLRYMARDGATETLAPILHQRNDEFIMRYMARKNATESVDVRDRGQLKQRMAKAQGSGGVAFGYGQVSLPHEDLRSAAADIQRLFDDGHTAMLTVLSFDEEFLIKHGLVPEGFVCRRRGDYRGHLDQMKLRLAIMHGLERMGRSLYDDLRYVGVIQVDTEHVHCHLVMVDAGTGTLAADGTQKGKINDRAKSLLRRGLDASLDRVDTVKHLASAVGYERSNVTTFVKKWAHQQMLRESLPQFLLACLPSDRRLWRLGTNNAAMRKPNQIVKQLVEEVFDRPGSPMPKAMEEVYTYANHRRDTEDLDRSQWQKLVNEGRNNIIERGANAVYALLRQLPDDALRVRTPMLDAMGMDYEDMARLAHEKGDSDDDLIGFGFRLRSFSARLDHHRSQREKYHSLAATWDEANAAGQASQDSRALREFYLTEEDYHARLAAKYQHFLSFIPDASDWYQDWDAVAEYGERLISLESMRRDQSLRRMKDEDEAERIGRDVYGQTGGRLVSRGTKAAVDRLEDRVRKMRATYAVKLDDLRVSLQAKGLRLSVVTDPATGRDTPSIVPGEEYPFEDVKGLDLHHMRYDFSQDAEVGQRTLATFDTAAALRSAAMFAAIAYLQASGQSESVADLPVADIRAMTALAHELVAVGPDVRLPSHVAELVREREALRRSRTVRLDADLSRVLVSQVDASVFAPTDDVPEFAHAEGLS